VQVDPIKPKLIAPGTMCLNLRYDKLLSTLAFTFGFRRYLESMAGAARQALRTPGSMKPPLVPPPRREGAYRPSVFMPAPGQYDPPGDPHVAPGRGVTMKTR